MEHITVEHPVDWTDYELLDSGNGVKLERFGTYTISRPDPRVLWQKHASEKIWESADAVYERINPTEGKWIIHRPPPQPWRVRYGTLTFTLRPTEFKHVGIFPEQAVNWNWIKTSINGKKLRVLNLFAYTGGATLAALSAGAEVTHVDSVKSAISWAKENLIASHLESKPVRWIEDDAYKFVLRESRRGATYDGIIMDPPRFGRGTKGEVWKLEQKLPQLLSVCKNILSGTPSFFLINAYTADLSALVLHHLLTDVMRQFDGMVTSGELTLMETSAKRLLPNGIYSRWSR